MFVTKLAKVFNNLRKKQPQKQTKKRSSSGRHSTVEIRVFRFRELSTKRMSVVILPGGICLSRTILKKSYLPQ